MRNVWTINQARGVACWPPHVARMERHLAAAQLFEEYVKVPMKENRFRFHAGEHCTFLKRTDSAGTSSGAFFGLTSTTRLRKHASRCRVFLGVILLNMHGGLQQLQK